MGVLRRWRDRRRPAWTSDREACESGGDNGLWSAFHWMLHVLERDYPDLTPRRAVIVVEAGEGQQAQVLYTTHSVDATPVEIRGLLEEGLRGLDELRLRAYRSADIERFVNEAMPALVEGVEGAVYGKAEGVAKAMRETLQKEEEIEGYGRQRLRDELVANGVTAGQLRRLAGRGADPETRAQLHELADELEKILAEPIMREEVSS